MKRIVLVKLMAFALFFSSNPSSAHAASIAWRKGKTEQAISLAKKDKRPVFIYWGAEWCPPCHEFKARYFSDPQFIDLMKGFVPVYLDGDSPDAQTWGEKLGVAGYPSIVILGSDGRVIARPSTLAKREDFFAQLKQIRSSQEPIEKIFEQVEAQADGEKVPHEIWRRIADHDWNGDPRVDEDEKQWAERYLALGKKVPARYKAIKSQLLLVGYLLKGRASTEEKNKLDPADRAALRELLKEILADKKQVQSCEKLLVYWAGEHLANAYGEDEGEALSKAVAGFKVLTHSLKTKATVASKFDYLQVSVDLSAIGNRRFAALSAEEIESVAREVKELLPKVKGEHDRGSAVPSASYVLWRLEKKEEAKKILVAELPRVKAPYHLMNMLSGIEKELGNKDAAIEWARKAFEVSKGDATKLQSGYDYIATLVELKPEEKDLVARELSRFFADGLRSTDSLRGRSQRRLTKLQKQLTDWAEKTQAKEALAEVIKTSRARCVQPGSNNGTDFSSACQAYFDTYK